LDAKYRAKGLLILCFPCNQFGKQEPGSAQEIKSFASKYCSNLLLFEKGDVNGAKARPLFQWLQTELGGTLGNSLKWNFTKFLVDANGKPFKRYGPTTSPLSIENDIVELLKQVAPESKQSEPAHVAGAEGAKSSDAPPRDANVQESVSAQDASQASTIVGKREGHEEQST